MQRHRFDPVSFFFGLAFTAIATYVLVMDDLDVFDTRWIWPVVLILGGLAVLASIISGRTSTPPGPATSGEEDTVDSASLTAAQAELPDEPHYR